MRESPEQDQRYAGAAAEFGPALQRLARATEANPERQRDLLQDMHVALWRSFAYFDGRCAVRTWVFRVAHNVAATHVDKERRGNRPLIPLDAIGELPDATSFGAAFEQSDMLARLHAVIRALGPPDRQIITLYLEEFDAAGIAEITGLSANAVAVRISRFKSRLARLFQETADV
jgi:RNA polymerase sigma-70 factor (ECF subfamily)